MVINKKHSELIFTDDIVVKKLEEFKPDVVAIASLFSSQVECALNVAAAIREAFPELLIVFGGNHATYRCEELLNSQEAIDFIFRGEADLSFSEFISKYIYYTNILNKKLLIVNIYLIVIIILSIQINSSFANFSILEYFYKIILLFIGIIIGYKYKIFNLKKIIGVIPQKITL